tara:strand:- start:4818 stop:7259 length:2442 start_codon:yes stop_codon:yes gene_type:complete
VAKITAYKLVNPEVSAKGNSTVFAVNQNTLAVNNLGVAVSSIADTVTDLAKVSALKDKLDKKNLIIKRRQERLEKDRAAEDAEETPAQKKKTEKKLSAGLKKSAKGAFGWISNFLGPIGSFLVDLGAFAITKEVLDYFADEENREKISTFLERTEFVWNKLKEIGTDIKETLSDGMDAIFGKETTIEERLEAFGKIALAIGGIGALLAAANSLPDRGLDRNRNQNQRNTQRAANAAQSGNAARTQVRSTSQGNQINQAGRQYRQNLDRAVRPGQTPSGIRQPVRPSRMAGFRANLQTGTANVPLTPGLQKAAYRVGPQAQKLARGASMAAKNAMGRIPFVGALISGIYTYFEDVDPMDGEPDKKLDKALFVAGGTALGGLLGSFIPIPVLGTALGAILGEYVGELMYILIRGDGIGAVGEKLKKDIAKLFEAGKLFVGWAGDGFQRFMEGAPKINIFGRSVPDPFFMINPLNVVDKVKLIAKAFFSRDTMNLNDKKIGEKVTIDGQEKYFAGDNYGFQSLDAYNKLVKDGVLPHPAGEAPPMGKSGGGLVRPQEMFLGGIVKGIGKAVSGVTNTVKKIGGAVSGIVNNPIVQAVAPMIPGVGPIVAGIGAVSGLMSGNPMAAIGAGLGMIPGMSGIMGQVGNFMNSPLGQIGGSLLSGNFMGAAMQGLGMIPGLSGLMSGGLGSIVGSVMGGDLGSAISTGAGMLGQQLGIPSGLMGIAKAALTGGDMTEGIAETAAQAGIDPKIIGAVKRTSNELGKGGLSAEYAMQEAIQFIPIPVVIKEALVVPKAVPINSSPPPAAPSAPSTLTQRMQQ